MFITNVDKLGKLMSNMRLSRLSFTFIIEYGFALYVATDVNITTQKHSRFHHSGNLFTLISTASVVVCCLHQCIDLSLIFYRTCDNKCTRSFPSMWGIMSYHIISYQIISEPYDQAFTWGYVGILFNLGLSCYRYPSSRTITCAAAQQDTTWVSVHDATVYATCTRTQK